jgi:CRP/FNR family cyclic AMP-dependent transcriptional regulator
MKRSIKPLGDVLTESVWMRSLPASIRERVVADAYETSHDDKELVGRKGEHVHSWIGVAEGFLKITGNYRSGKVVMFSGIPMGAWVGEGSVIKRELRHYDIVAMGRTRVVHIPRATFHWLLDSSFEFNHFIIDHLNERLAQFMAMVETDRLTDPVAKISRAISGLFNPVIYPGVGPLLKVSQAELGELAGLSRQTVNAAIKQLEKSGVVRVEYGGLLVTDLAALRRFQDGA